MTPPATPSAPAGLPLALAGELRDGRHVVRVGDVEIALTNAPFHCLAELARSRLATRTGLTRPPRDCLDKASLHQVIRRLRQALDGALGPGAGRALVVHGARSAYSLAVDPAAIAIDVSLAELAPYHVAQGLVEDLMRLGRKGEAFVSGA